MTTRHIFAEITILLLFGASAVHSAKPASADNRRLNDGIIANVYTLQRQAGCDTDILGDPRLRLAAQWHTIDVLNNQGLNGKFGSDGTTPQERARAAGFEGTVAETVAINPALAISGVEVMRQWHNDPAALAIMRDCTHTAIGVWSENSISRSVVVAVYGRPAAP